MRFLYCLLLLVVALVQIQAANVFVSPNGRDRFDNRDNNCQDPDYPCKSIAAAIYACPTTVYLSGSNGKFLHSGNAGMQVNTSCTFIGENTVIDMEGNIDYFMHMRLTGEAVTISGITFANAVVNGALDFITVSSTKAVASQTPVTLQDVWFENVNVNSPNNSVVNFSDVYSVQLRNVTYLNNQGLSFRATGGNAVSFQSVYLSGCKEVSHQIRGVTSVYVVDSNYVNSETGLLHPALFNIFGGSLYYSNTNITNVQSFGHAPVILLDNMDNVRFESGKMEKLSNEKLYDPFMNVFNAMNLYISPKFVFLQNIGGINLASIARGYVAAQFIENSGINAVVTNGGNWTWVSNFVNPVPVRLDTLLSVVTSMHFTPTAPVFKFHIMNGTVTTNNSDIFTTFTILNDNSTLPLYVTVDSNILGAAGHSLVTNGPLLYVDVGNVTVSDISCNGNSTIILSNRTSLGSFDCWAAKQGAENTCTFYNYCDHCTGGSSCEHPPPTPIPTSSPNGGGGSGDKPVTHRWWFILLIILGCCLVLGLLIFAIQRSNAKKDYQPVN